jgi:hypothetical protein
VASNGFRVPLIHLECRRSRSFDRTRQMSTKQLRVSTSTATGRVNRDIARGQGNGHALTGSLHSFAFSSPVLLRIGHQELQIVVGVVRIMVKEEQTIDVS